jgi:hypothetical protein
MAKLASLERYIARAMSSASTVVDQLIFLASLRDTYTGQYVHEGWMRIAPTGEIHRGLQEAHQRSFECALGLSVIELSKQLRSHFQSLGRPERETSLLWLEAEPFRELLPSGCSAVLRELFVSQIRTALEILYRVPDWANLKAPIALPHSQPDRPPLPLPSN